MEINMKCHLACILVLATASPVVAQTRLSIEGVVIKQDGTPAPGARVSIATAAVRKGTSPY